MGFKIFRRVITKFTERLNRKTLHVMIAAYCRANHRDREKNSNGLCRECEEVYSYSVGKLQKCPFGWKKPNCPKCRVSCYSDEMKSRLRVIMRFSGPRMAWHPVLSFYHFINNFHY